MKDHKVNEIWMCGTTTKDKIHNEHKMAPVVSITWKKYEAHSGMPTLEDTKLVYYCVRHKS